MYKTYDQIVQELQADMVANGSVATDFSSGSQIQTMINVAARGYYTHWYMLELLVELFFVASSEGPFLDLRVGERGITRKLGSAATGSISFTRTTPCPVNTDILDGTTFSTLDGSVSVTTNADTPLASGWTSGSVEVTCTKVGVAGNLAAGTQLRIVGPTPSGLQTITVGAGGLTGGVDEETDDQLRARYLYTIQNPADGGTPGDYQVWASQVTGVTNEQVFPLARGNGTVDVVIASNGIPSADLVAQVQSVISANRPIGADAQVKAPTANTTDVTGTITPATGYTFATLQPVVFEAITNHLNSVSIGDVVRVSGITKAIMSVQGVLDYSLSAPAANIVLTQEQMAVPGTITITQGN
ncbi:baseplate J-like protein [Desulfosporosinus acididurans]|uniref:Baseplate J-like protein n=1 Tax=Desulfosporosinus acididurans TaxID=476652 RepID=A0A0J1INP6_9FIRM|nr:baseplate J-like protein [Desulfosporosinus acididurans]